MAPTEKLSSKTTVKMQSKDKKKISKSKKVSIPSTYKGVISEELMEKCISSLIGRAKVDATQSTGGKKSIFDDAAGSDWTKGRLCLDIVSFKVPMREKEVTARPIHPKINRFPVPHTLTDGSTTVLLITKDHPKVGADVGLSNAHHKVLLTNAACNHLVTEIMTLSQLKAEMMEVESRKELCARFDVVLCESHLVKIVPRLLGRHFLVAKKHPISVKLDASNLKKEIESKLSQATHKMTFRNTQSSLTFGRSCQTIAELTENLEASLLYLSTKFPGGWKNIKTLYLTMGLKSRMPLYVSTCTNNQVPIPKIAAPETEVFEGDFGFGHVKMTSNFDLVSYAPADDDKANIRLGHKTVKDRGNRQRYKMKRGRTVKIRTKTGGKKQKSKQSQLQKKKATKKTK